MFALKGLMNYKEKQPWFFQIERAEKTKKRRPRASQGSCPPKPPFWKTTLLSITERL